MELYLDNLIEEKTLTEILLEKGVTGITGLEETGGNGITTGGRFVGSEFENCSFKSTSTGARLEIFPSSDQTIGMVVYSSTGTEVFKLMIAGTDVSDVIIGNYAGGTGIKWDQSAGTFTIKGTILASTIDIGTNAFHVDLSGNLWWGSSTTYAGATYKISAAGVANLSGLVVGTNVGLGTAQDSSGVTTIIGNTVTTGYVNALSVVAGSVAAENITGSTITGLTVQTAASGARVVMGGGAEWIKFYDATVLCGTFYGSGGSMLIQAGQSDKNVLIGGGTSSGHVALYDSNSLKLLTSSTGIAVSGNIAVTGTVDGTDIASHVGDASAHHSSTSNNLAITPASVNAGTGALRGGSLYYSTTQIAGLTGGYMDLYRPLIHYFGALNEASEGSKGMVHVQGTPPNEEMRVYLNGGWRTVTVV